MLKDQSNFPPRPSVVERGEVPMGTTPACSRCMWALGFAMTEEGFVAVLANTEDELVVAVQPVVFAAAASPVDERTAVEMLGLWLKSGTIEEIVLVDIAPGLVRELGVEELE